MTARKLAKTSTKTQADRVSLLLAGADMSAKTGGDLCGIGIRFSVKSGYICPKFRDSSGKSSVSFSRSSLFSIDAWGELGDTTAKKNLENSRRKKQNKTKRNTPKLAVNPYKVDNTVHTNRHINQEMSRKPWRQIKVL